MKYFSKKKVTALIVFVFVVVGIKTLIPEPKIIQIAPIIVEKKEAPLVSTAIIGHSVQGREIQVTSYGNGLTHLTFVGGIHGGYEWNSVLLAYTMMDYLALHPEVIPKNLTIDIIPSANPDAIYTVTGKEGRFSENDISRDEKVLTSARFNNNTVDLNRNFDCKWKPKSTWKLKTVSAGTSAFSEPESQAIRDFMMKFRPTAVVFWHSQANGVFASTCKDTIVPETINIMNTYAKASGYKATKTFDAYETTGAADDWLASINIPAVTVELKTHTKIDWEENLAGVKALIEYYRK